MPKTRPASTTRARPQRGFTLVEVLVAIGIVMAGLLIVALAVIPGLRNQRSFPACASNLRQVAQAYAVYSLDFDGSHPQAGLLTHPTMRRTYGLDKVDRCPIHGREYLDVYARGMASTRKLPLTTVFPNGARIPVFDPDSDVLARCLDHGYDGFDKGSPRVWIIDERTKGCVLAVRADATVVKVAPISCFEFASWPTTLTNRYPRLWKRCDRPSTIQ